MTMSRRNNDTARRGAESRRDLESCCPDCGSWRHTSCEGGGNRRGFGTAIVGIGILLVGSLLLLDNFGYADAQEYFAYWPVLLILLGLSYFFRPKASRCIITGIVWIGIGTVVLLSNLGHIGFEIWDLWPAVLIIVGANLILKPFRRRGLSIADDSGIFEATAILGGANRRLSAANFQGGDATAIMGGCEIDLRDCGSEGGPAQIDTFAFWGGIDIRVPEDWEVQVKGLAILGAYSDKTHSIEGDGRKVLVIGGAAIMGGVEIKN
jgi:predicted membrane protein